MEKQRNDSLKGDESTLAEDIADYINGNNVDDSSIMEEVDCKIRRIEPLRASYRWWDNELKIILLDRCAEVYEEGYENKLQNIKNASSLKKDMSKRRSKADNKQGTSKARSEIFLGKEVKSVETITSFLQRLNQNTTSTQHLSY